MRSRARSIAQELAKNNTVDLLTGGAKANPKPTLANGAPTIYTAQGPTELIVFRGQPDFVPIVGTQLLWAANTTSDVLIDTADSSYYVLLAGRWFRSAAITGPWTFVAGERAAAGLREDPARVARGRRAADGRGHAAGAGRGDRELDSADGDGAAQGRPDVHAELRRSAAVRARSRTRRWSYVDNSSEPVIQVAPNAYYAVAAGVWFTAPQLTGPWTVATSVPAVIYEIPASSPVHYVTYVRIYGATPQYVYVGYTPGYLGTIVTPEGTVVYGTGYAYTPWIGSVWYPPPYTYARGRAARLQPVRRLHVRLRAGSRDRRVDRALLGRRVLPPGVLGRLSVLRVGERERLRPLGRHHVLGHAHVVRRRRRRRHDGERQLLQRAHRHVRHVRRGPPVQRVDRQRVARLRPHGEHGGGRLGRRRARRQLQHVHGPALHRVQRVGDRRRRQHVPALRRDDGGAGRLRARGRGLHLQREDRQHQHVGHGERRATTTTPTSTATCTRTPATAGSSTRRAGGRAPAATRRGRTASRRRGAAATASVAAAGVATARSAAVATAAAGLVAIVSAAAASAATGSAAVAAAAGADASAAAADSAAADSGAAAASGADRQRRETRPHPCPLPLRGRGSSLAVPCRDGGTSRSGAFKTAIVCAALSHCRRCAPSPRRGEGWGEGPRQCATASSVARRPSSARVGASARRRDRAS